MCRVHGKAIGLITSGERGESGFAADGTRGVHYAAGPRDAQFPLKEKQRHGSGVIAPLPRRLSVIGVRVFSRSCFPSQIPTVLSARKDIICRSQIQSLAFSNGSIY